MNKYLYTFVSGGMNDILCQVQRSIDYAKKYNRIIYFDKKDVTFEFWNIFNINCSEVKIINDINQTTISLIDNKNIKQLDYSRDYDSNLLVFYKPGGGNDSHNLISYLTLKEDIIKQFYERLNEIYDSYIGIHIRNTDIKSNINKLLHLIKDKNFDCIFLSTDDLHTLNLFQNIYGDRIRSFSRLIPLNNNNSLHHCKNINKNIKNTDAILDLLCLANASDLYCAEMLNHPSLDSTTQKKLLFGGYSRLAIYLHNNKQLMKKLLQSP